MNETEYQVPLSEYGFEQQFDERGAIEWMQENWSKAFVYCGLYAALVFGGQLLVKERPKLHLRGPLVLWSLSLQFEQDGTCCISSPPVVSDSLCEQSFYNGPVSKFWAYAFVLSHAPELGKNWVFIVLRKQRLLFLHWYHHVTVLLYSWYSYKDQVAGGGWFMPMNYSVHLVYCWMQDGDCQSYLNNIVWSSLMYLSYLVLFSFYQTYLKDKGGNTGKSSKTD
uniref:Elongation of very long chain fatty acids protein n=1 Tax=Salmo trutta TaxID=8032 RepID=A0A673XF09_SALTR